MAMQVNPIFSPTGVDFLSGQPIEALQLDCKTVGFFFSKSVKKSVKRGV